MALSAKTKFLTLGFILISSLVNIEGFNHNQIFGGKNSNKKNLKSILHSKDGKLRNFSPNPLKAVESDVETLRKKAQTLKLQSEKLKLEAERDALVLKQETNAALLVELQRNLTLSQQQKTEAPQDSQTAGPVLGSGPEVVLAARQNAPVEIVNPFQRAIPEEQQEDKEQSKKEEVSPERIEELLDEEVAERTYNVFKTIQSENKFVYFLFFNLVKLLVGRNMKDAEEMKALLLESFKDVTDGKEAREAYMEMLPRIEAALAEITDQDPVKLTTNTTTGVDAEVYTLPHFQSQSVQSVNQTRSEEIQQELQDISKMFNMTEIAESSKDWQDDVYVQRVFQNSHDLTSDEIDTLKTEVFGKDSFYVNKISQYATAIIFEGLPQTFKEKEGEVIRGKREIDFIKLNDVIQERLAKSSLADRVQLHLVRDPREIDPEDMDVDMLLKEIVEGKDAVFAATTKEATTAEPAGAKSYAVLAAGFIASMLLSANFAIQPFGTTVEIPPSAISQTLEIAIFDAQEILSYMIAFHALVFTVQRLTAAFEGIKVGPTFFLPAYHLGTYGTWSSFIKPPKSNNAVFDYAISGPVTGFLISIGLILVGSQLTATADPSELQLFPVVPAQIFQESFIIGKAVQSIIPSYLTMPDVAQTLVYMHPAAIAGMAGIYSTACSMFPVARTDGGRALRAAWGRDVFVVIQFLVTILLIIPAIIGKIDVVLFYTIFLQFTAIKEPDVPAENEFDEPGEGKKVLHGILTLIALLAFIPNPVKSFLETGSF
mmetsp:Transcript_40790/g.53737  ORF Transcript_40790/g.53737 Transcript_40790/m.53737 type:complete len:770 (+) Transcript_40790:143-2452(+)